MESAGSRMAAKSGGLRRGTARMLSVIKIVLFVIIHLTTLADAKSSPGEEVSVDITSKDRFPTLLVSMCAIMVVCVAVIIVACACWRVDRFFIKLAKRINAKCQSYRRVSMDSTSRDALSATFGLAYPEHKPFVSPNVLSANGVSLKTTADALADRLNGLDQPKSYLTAHCPVHGLGRSQYGIAPWHGENGFQNAPSCKDNWERRNSFRMSGDKKLTDGIAPWHGENGFQNAPSCKDNWERRNSFRMNGDKKLTDDLIREYWQKKLSARNRMSAERIDDPSGSPSAFRRGSAGGSNEDFQRKLATLRKLSAGNTERPRRKLCRQVSSSDEDLWMKPAAMKKMFGRQWKSPHIKQLAGHQSFTSIAYEQEDRFGSAWEARAFFLDANRFEELATISERELDEYRDYFSKEEWEQIRRRWLLAARTYGTIQEELSEYDDHQHNRLNMLENSLGRNSVPASYTSPFGDGMKAVSSLDAFGPNVRNVQNGFHSEEEEIEKRNVVATTSSDSQNGTFSAATDRESGIESGGGHSRASADGMSGKPAPK